MVIYQLEVSKSPVTVKTNLPGRSTLRSQNNIPLPEPKKAIRRNAVGNGYYLSKSGNNSNFSKFALLHLKARCAEIETIIREQKDSSRERRFESGTLDGRTDFLLLRDAAFEIQTISVISRAEYKNWTFLLV